MRARPLNGGGAPRGRAAQKSPSSVRRSGAVVRRTIRGGWARGPRALLRRDLRRGLRLGRLVLFHALLERLDAFREVAHHVGELPAAAEQHGDHRDQNQPMPDAETTHVTFLEPKGFTRCREGDGAARALSRENRARAEACPYPLKLRSRSMAYTAMHRLIFPAGTPDDASLALFSAGRLGALAGRGTRGG